MFSKLRLLLSKKQIHEPIILPIEMVSWKTEGFGQFRALKIAKLNFQNVKLEIAEPRKRKKICSQGMNIKTIKLIIESKEGTFLSFLIVLSKQIVQTNFFY